MESRLTIGLDHINLGGAAADINMTRRPNTQSNTLVIHRQDGDFDIFGEFDRLPDFPA